MNFYHIPGITAPFLSDPSPKVRHESEDRAIAHLQALEARYGAGQRGNDGRVRFRSGEDVAYRLVRDGYAVPTLDRRDLAKTRQASQKAQRGMWAAAIDPAATLAMQGARALLNASDELTR